MFKVSFKDNYKNVKRPNEKITTVSLIGRMKFPLWWYSLPRDIMVWVYNHSSIEAAEELHSNTMIIRSIGGTCKSDKDEDNPIYAERIAEARAKIRLYRFMCTLLKKIHAYYCSLAFGIPDFTPISTVKGSVWESYRKYNKLYIKEMNHLNELLQEE